MWKREITRWGNSLGIRIPNQVFQKTNFKEGDEVAVEYTDEDTILIRKGGQEESSQTSGEKDT